MNEITHYTLTIHHNNQRLWSERDTIIIAAYSPLRWHCSTWTSTAPARSIQTRQCLWTLSGWSDKAAGEAGVEELRRCTGAGSLVHQHINTQALVFTVTAQQRRASDFWLCLFWFNCWRGLTLAEIFKAVSLMQNEERKKNKQNGMLHCLLHFG